ncbi:hypothetical protein TNCV_605611 [Trichonephila clavipes]|nr:hypothetical protein TNCV_605611 [Trichonephila clavipes]
MIPWQNALGRFFFSEAISKCKINACEPDDIGNLNKEVIDLVMQINSDDVQELLDSHKQDMTIEELIEL